MKRKKLLILLLSSCLTLTACGGGSANTGRGDNHIDASANENMLKMQELILKYR